MSARSPFETSADCYDAWFDAHPEAYEAELQAVRAVLPELAGRWVEIGVGTGRFASRLGIGLGIEPAAEMAARARERGVRVLEGIAESLPLEAASVDAVFFITTLCFVSDVARALAEARRVLVPNGSIIAGFLPRDSEFGRRLAAGPPDLFFAKAHLLSTSELLSALIGAGFQVVRIVQTLTTSPCRTVPELPSDGFDRGSFVVVRGVRPQHKRRCSMQS